MKFLQYSFCKVLDTLTGGGEVFTGVDVATVHFQIVYNNCGEVLEDLLLCAICSACGCMNQ